MQQLKEFFSVAESFRNEKTRIDKKATYAIILDSTPDISHKEQIKFVIRCVSTTNVVLDESRSFFRVHTGYFSNIPKCIKAEFIASWACSQSSVVSSSQR
ncbi:hypothetical protein TNCV_3609241 [Trichonephila clavipes]|nr:hypothetical protein TNCV_3609241 [Trichonephila clavipes]